MSTDISLCKIQFSKLIYSRNSLNTVRQISWYIMKIAVPLAKNVLVALAIMAWPSAIDDAIQERKYVEEVTSKWEQKTR